MKSKYRYAWERAEQANPKQPVVMCSCPWCDKDGLTLSEYRDGFSIIECKECHFDDKDYKGILIKRYYKNT